jgi:RNA polymerase sigma-70 factor, ECF subfamily
MAEADPCGICTSTEFDDDTEHVIRRACQQQDFDRATAAAIAAYGPDILRYLRAIAGRAVADDAYSEFALDLWQALPSFGWRCSAKTYAYTLARNAATRMQIKAARDAHGRCAFLNAPWLQQALAHTRTPTPDHAKTEVKARLNALRAALSEEERSLLILKVNKRLSFKEIAHVLGMDDGDDVALARAAAALRKRFQYLKQKLRRQMLAADRHP